MIYPTLMLLEEMDLIEIVDPLATRKCYHLRAQGHVASEQGKALSAIVQRLRALAVLAHNRTLPDIEQAIDNFKTVLNTRLSRPDLPQQTLYAIIDALDDAAKKNQTLPVTTGSAAGQGRPSVPESRSPCATFFIFVTSLVDKDSHSHYYLLAFDYNNNDTPGD